MRKRILAVLISFGFVLAAFAGCGSPSGSASATDSSGQDMFGQVTAVDGASVTLALISTPGGDIGGGRQLGQRPQGSSRPRASGQHPQGSFRPRASGQGQNNEGQYQPGGTRGGMELSGETKTLAITDTTAITKGGMGAGQQDASPSPASISDITVGSYLRVTMSGDTVASVTILQFRNRGGNAGASPSPTVSPSPSPTASPSPGYSIEPGIGTKLG